jgi:glycosyltransferase involved in cell wall biosynthesis
MHILHIETGRHLYGGALQVLYLMEGLEGQGCKNTLACVRGSEIAGAASACAVIYELSMAGELDPCFVFRLLRIIRRERPDIVHVHSRRGADLWAALAAHATKTKAVLTRRVDNPEPSWVARVKYRPYDRVITISNGIRRVLMSEGVPAKKIVCVPSAVDGQPYEHECAKEWFCREFGLDPGNKMIGVIAQFIPRKGHQYLIEAAPGILSQHPDTRFLFFGRGPLQGKLQQLCKKYNIANQVYFVGFRNDLERILSCLDLVVHPATMEGLGISLLQAAAAGVPIVASSVGGIPEIVHDGVNGVLVPPDDIPALTSAVIRLLGDIEKASVMGRTGRQLIRTEFPIEKMVEGNLRVYRQVLTPRWRQGND